MVETITLRPIYLEDLALGTGTVQVQLADGSTAALSKINLTALGLTSGNNTVDFIEQSSTPSTPPANVIRLYQKSDGYWYTVDDAGTEAEWPRTLGTVTRGTWNATTLGVPYGGTGLTSLTAGDTLYASGANTLAKAAIGAANTVWKSNGTAPSWAQSPYTSIHTGRANPTNATLYNMPGGGYYDVGPSEALVSIPWPATGTFSKLYVVLSGAHSVDFTVTLRVNGSDTSVTATVTAGATTGSDLVHTASVTAGQLVSVKYVSTSNSVLVAKWAFEFTE